MLTDTLLLQKGLQAELSCGEDTYTTPPASYLPKSIWSKISNTQTSPSLCGCHLFQQVVAGDQVRAGHTL